MGPTADSPCSRPATEISLADIFRAIDGPLADVHDESLRDLSTPAPAEALPEVWMAIRGSLRSVLETVTSPTSSPATFRPTSPLSPPTTSAPPRTAMVR